MAPYEEQDLNEKRTSDAGLSTTQWLVVALIVLLAVAGYSLFYGARQRSLAQQMKEQANATTASMGQLQAQVSSLTAKLNELTSPQPAPALPAPASAPPAASEDTTAPTPAPVAASSPADTASATTAVAATPKPAPAKKRAATKRRAPVDKRYAQLKSQLDEQEKQLKDTQDAVAKNRADLEGSISTTRDELNGSIAKTHDELVALEKRGERSYFEFDLSKSKQFQRFGPLTLSLRKADTKHKNYDLAMIVDDNELNKKKVNLYEPIWIHTESGAQPIQVVVNRIEKNLIHGYVSAPKYKQSELAALSSSMTPSPPDSGNPQPVSQPQQ
jgi:cell division protein FtsB